VRRTHPTLIQVELALDIHSAEYQRIHWVVSHNGA